MEGQVTGTACKAAGGGLQESRVGVKYRIREGKKRVRETESPKGEEETTREDIIEVRKGAEGVKKKNGLQ